MIRAIITTLALWMVIVALVTLAIYIVREHYGSKPLAAVCATVTGLLAYLVAPWPKDWRK